MADLVEFSSLDEVFDILDAVEGNSNKQLVHDVKGNLMDIVGIEKDKFSTVNAPSSEDTQQPGLSTMDSSGTNSEASSDFQQSQDFKKTSVISKVSNIRFDEIDNGESCHIGPYHSEAQDNMTELSTKLSGSSSSTKFRDFLKNSQLPQYIQDEIKSCQETGLKPKLSYLEINACALLSSPTGQLLLNDIYDWIIDSFPYYLNANPKWKGNVRFYLTHPDCFEKCEKASKGYYWRIKDVYLEPFRNGNIKSKNKRTGKRGWEDTDPDELEQNSIAAAKRPRKPKQTQNVHKTKPIVVDPAVDVDTAPLFAEPRNLQEYQKPSMSNQVSKITQGRAQSSNDDASAFSSSQIKKNEVPQTVAQINPLTSDIIQKGMEAAENYSAVLNSNFDDSRSNSSFNKNPHDLNGSYNCAQSYNGASSGNQSHKGSFGSVQTYRGSYSQSNNRSFGQHDNRSFYESYNVSFSQSNSRSFNQFPSETLCGSFNHSKNDSLNPSSDRSFGQPNNSYFDPSTNGSYSQSQNGSFDVQPHREFRPTSHQPAPASTPLWGLMSPPDNTPPSMLRQAQRQLSKSGFASGSCQAGFRASESPHRGMPTQMRSLHDQAASISHRDTLPSGLNQATSNTASAPQMPTTSLYTAQFGSYPDGFSQQGHHIGVRSSANGSSTNQNQKQSYYDLQLQGLIPPHV